MQRTVRVRLDDALLAKVKKYAAEKGRTVTAVIEDALREFLERQRTAAAASRVKLTTFGGKGLRPGVNLDDSAALLEVMEGRTMMH